MEPALTFDRGPALPDKPEHFRVVGYLSTPSLTYPDPAFFASRPKRIRII
jgi:hypothetical protein